MLYQVEVTLKNGKSLAVTREDNDTPGPPRYVIHYPEVADTYSEALALSRKIGGKMYTTKWYGGGIVFSTYNLEQTLNELMTHAGKL